MLARLFAGALVALTLGCGARQSQPQEAHQGAWAAQRNYPPLPAQPR